MQHFVLLVAVPLSANLRNLWIVIICALVPNRNDRVRDNDSGAFYVDSTCIDCDVCRDLAPQNFLRSFKHAYSYVSKQPENETERDACQEALACCPVEAIGDDG
jgi:ferredoxin